jgi:hypothetical protein
MRYLVVHSSTCCHHKLSIAASERKGAGSSQEVIQEDHPLCYFIPLKNNIRRNFHRQDVFGENIHSSFIQ